MSAVRLALVLGLLLPALPAWARPSIHVAAHAEVRTAQVRLGDVARLDGFETADRKRLAALDLGPAPMAGTGRLLPKAYLASALEAAELPRGTQVRLPSRLEVSRAARTLRGGDLASAVEGAVRDRLPPGTEISAIHVPSLPDLKVPSGATRTIEISIPATLAEPVTAEVAIRDGDQLVRSQKVSVRVDAMGTAFEAVEAIARGRVLGEADVRPVRRPESQIPKDAIRDAAELAGATLRRDVRDGEPLTRRMLDLPPLVKRGDRVTMTAARGAIRITAIGEALGPGRQGESVKVRNLDSLKIVSGRVTGPQTITMEM